jgi:zinc transport system ATP-binding protein
MADPELLLLDEPTSSIDPYGSFCLFEFLSSLQSSHTIVVVSHDLIVSAMPFTSLAVINRTLKHSKEGGIKPELIDALYGAHIPGCPLSPIARQITNRLNELSMPPKDCRNA